MNVRTLAATILSAMAVAACGTADGDDLLGQPAPAFPSPSEHSATDVYAVSNTASEGDASARAQTDEDIERCLAAPGISSRREASPPARHIVSLTASATGAFEACISSVPAAALTPYVRDERGLQPGQQVALHHCGVVNVHYEGQEWEVENAPVDATNAPEEFSGIGSFERQREALVFSDEKGATLTFTLWDGTPDPDGCA